MKTIEGLKNCIRRSHEMILEYGNKTDESSIGIVRQAMKNMDDAERLLSAIEERIFEAKLKALSASTTARRA